MYKLDRNGITKANKHFWKPKIDKFPAIDQKLKTFDPAQKFIEDLYSRTK